MERGVSSETDTFGVPIPDTVVGSHGLLKDGGVAPSRFAGAADGILLLELENMPKSTSHWSVSYKQINGPGETNEKIFQTINVVKA